MRAVISSPNIQIKRHKQTPQTDPLYFFPVLETIVKENRNELLSIRGGAQPNELWDSETIRKMVRYGILQFTPEWDTAEKGDKELQFETDELSFTFFVIESDKTLENLYQLSPEVERILDTMASKQFGIIYVRKPQKYDSEKQRKRRQRLNRKLQRQREKENIIKLRNCWIPDATKTIQEEIITANFEIFKRIRKSKQSYPYFDIFERRRLIKLGILDYGGVKSKALFKLTPEANEIIDGIIASYEVIKIYSSERTIDSLVKRFTRKRKVVEDTPKEYKLEHIKVPVSRKEDPNLYSKWWHRLNRSKRKTMWRWRLDASAKLGSVYLYNWLRNVKSGRMF